MASLKTKVNAVASGSGSAAGSRTPSSMGRNLSRVREQDGGDSDGEDSDLEAAVTLEFLVRCYLLSVPISFGTGEV